MILLDANICFHVVNIKPPVVLERFRHHSIGDFELLSNRCLLHEVVVAAC